MGRKNKSTTSRKRNEAPEAQVLPPPPAPIPAPVPAPAPRTPSAPTLPSPGSAMPADIQDLLAGSSNGESDSELELLKAIGAPPELMREVKGDIYLRQKISQIIRSSEEETASILKQTKEEPPEPPKPEPEPDKKNCAFCGKDAETRCTGCRQVFYCNKNCQKEHWTEHKDACRPYVVSKTASGEKILVASRDLKAEDFILAESPIVLGPRQITEPICLGCYRTIDGSYKCSKCTWPMCGKACEDSPCHQPECIVTQRAALAINIDAYDGPHPFYEIITALRCLVVAGKEGKRWKNHVEKFNTRYTELVGNEQYIHNEEVVVKLLRESFKLQQHQTVDASVASIHNVLGILQTNNVPVKTLYAEVQGLFPNASLCNHSCIPNTKLFWEEKSRLRLTATEMIKKGDPITINYTDMLWGTRSRRDYLQQSRVISCTCKRCADPTEMSTYFSAFKCQQCPKSTPVLSTNPLDNTALWKCTVCDYKIDSEEVMNVTVQLGGEVAESLSQPTIPTLEKVQKEWLKKVHNNHYHLHAVKHSLLQLYGRDQEKKENKSAKHWEEIAKKEKCCKDFLLVCSKLDPSMSYTIPYVGLTFYEYHKTIVQNAKRNYGLAQINEQQLKKRLMLAKALLKKAMDIFKDEAEDTPEGHLFNICREEAVSIGSWMLAVGLV